MNEALSFRARSTHPETEIHALETEAFSPSQQPKDYDAVPNYGSCAVFTRDVIAATPAGSVPQPAMILEIGGGDTARGYDPAELKRKHLIVGNLDRFKADWGDRRLLADVEELQNGLKDPRLQEFLAGTSLGSVVLGHIVKFLDTGSFRSLIHSALEQLQPGGRIIILDVFDNAEMRQRMRRLLERHETNSPSPSENPFTLKEVMVDRLYRAVRILETQAEQDGYRLHRSLLGPLLPHSLYDKLRRGTRDIRDLRELREEYHLQIVKQAVETPPVRSLAIGNKHIIPGIMESVIELEKIDPVRERDLRRRQRQQRRDKRR